MTGLDLLELVVDKPTLTAGEYVRLAIKAELMSPPSDGRRLARPLGELRRHDLVDERVEYRGHTARPMPRTYTPTGHGRKVLGAVKRARALQGFVPYSQIKGVDYLVAGVLARAV